MKAAANHNMDAEREHKLSQNSPLVNLVAGLSLGLLTGWCYFLFLIVYPCLVYLILAHHSSCALAVLSVFIGLSTPLDFTQRKWFMKSWFFKIWRNYFQHTYDCSSHELKPGQKYLFCEFPHGVFPMGQFLCAPILDQIIPRGESVCGIGADIVFSVPVLRQIMSWIGTRSATREGVRTILSNDSHVTVLPGGIAEMYLVTYARDIIPLGWQLKKACILYLNLPLEIQDYLRSLVARKSQLLERLSASLQLYLPLYSDYLANFAFLYYYSMVVSLRFLEQSHSISPEEK